MHIDIDRYRHIYRYIIYLFPTPLPGDVRPDGVPGARDHRHRQAQPRLQARVEARVRLEARCGEAPGTGAVHCEAFSSRARIESSETFVSLSSRLESNKEERGYPGSVKVMSSVDETANGLISQKVCITSFCISQLPHKFVILSSYFTKIKSSTRGA